MAVKYAGNFNGTTSKMTVANYVGSPAAFSVAMWVSLTASQVSRIFFDNFQVTGSKGWTVGVHDTLTNKLKFSFTGSTLASATALTNATWYYVVFTYDGTTAKIYLNGSSTPDASSAIAVSYGTVPVSNSIGALTSGSQWTNGFLAAVGVWSKALSTTEMTALYNLGSGLSYSDLSGTLLTSLVSYNDFSYLGNLGLESVAGYAYVAANVTQTSGSILPYSSIILADSPVSYWKTDATTGGFENDSVGTNNATISGAATINQPGPGSLVSVLFNGTTSYLIASTAANLQITGNITLECWAKLTSAPRTNAFSRVVEKGYTSNSSPFDDYAIYAEGASGCFGFALSTGTTRYLANGLTTPTAGVWYHLCGTYDGSNVRFYVNGVLQSTTPASGAIRNDAQPFMIGAGNYGGISDFFPGNISNVVIYNTVLPQTRIASRTAAVPATSVRVSQVGALVVGTGSPGVRVSQTGVLIVGATNPNLRVSQVGLVTVYTATPSFRVSQVGMLTVYAGTPKVRDSQIGALVIATGSPKVRDSQIGALVIATGSPKVRDSQIGALVVTSTILAPSLARISQEGMLVAYTGTPKARISQEGTVVVYTGTPLARISQTGTLVVWQAGVITPTPTPTSSGACLLMTM